MEINGGAERSYSASVTFLDTQPLLNTQSFQSTTPFQELLYRSTTQEDQPIYNSEEHFAVQETSETPEQPDPSFESQSLAEREHTTPAVSAHRQGEGEQNSTNRVHDASSEQSSQSDKAGSATTDASEETHNASLSHTIAAAVPSNKEQLKRVVSHHQTELPAQHISFALKNSALLQNNSVHAAPRNSALTVISKKRGSKKVLKSDLPTQTAQGASHAHTTSHKQGEGDSHIVAPHAKKAPPIHPYLKQFFKQDGKQHVAETQSEVRHLNQENIRSVLVDNRTDIDSLHTLKSIQPKKLSFENMLQEYKQHINESEAQTIVKHARLVLKNDQESELKLLLRPAELGTMRLKLNMQNNVIGGKIVVDSALAKDIVEQGLSDLQRLLKNNGIESDVIDVFVNNHHNESQQFAHAHRFSTVDGAVDGTVSASNTNQQLSSELIERGLINVLA